MIVSSMIVRYWASWLGAQGRCGTGSSLGLCQHSCRQVITQEEFKEEVTHGCLQILRANFDLRQSMKKRYRDHWHRPLAASETMPRDRAWSVLLFALDPTRHDPVNTSYIGCFMCKSLAHSVRFESSAG